MTRPIGYVAADVEGTAPQELVRMLGEIGYTAVDWTMEQFDPLVDGKSRLQQLVTLAADAGLAVPQLMVHQDYVTPDPRLWEERVRRTERAIEAAAATGIPTVGLVTGPNRWAEDWAVVGRDVETEAAWDLALHAVNRVLDHAADHDVAVSLEPCWGTLAWNAATADDFLRRLGRDELQLNFDPSHFVMTGDQAPDLVRHWADRIAHVHLKDAFGVTGDFEKDFCFLLPGEGKTDWPALLAALDDINYRGAMSVEFESFTLRENVFRGDIEAGARLAYQLVAGLLQSNRAQAQPDRQEMRDDAHV